MPNFKSHYLMAPVHKTFLTSSAGVPKTLQLSLKKTQTTPSLRETLVICHRLHLCTLLYLSASNLTRSMNKHTDFCRLRASRMR